MDLKLPKLLFWAGSSLEFMFTGTELHLVFEADFSLVEPWVSIELNSAPLLRVPLDRGTNRFCLFRGMTPGVPKRVRVFKETQPITDDSRHRLEVTEVTGAGGEILPVPPRALFLEFIGDSLTSGEGVIGALQETDWVSPLFSASRSWARQTADLLGADFRAVSQSGWGCAPAGTATSPTLSRPGTEKPGPCGTGNRTPSSSIWAPTTPTPSSPGWGRLIRTALRRGCWPSSGSSGGSTPPLS